MKTYKIATGVGKYHLNAPIDPEEVGQELDKLGSFTTEDLLKVASSPRSPLHKYFEWDDRKAAHQFRLVQARHLVLSIGFETDDGIMRTHESVVIDEQRQYVPFEDIARTEDLTEQVIASALRELVFWKTKHQKYKTFFIGTFGGIEKDEEALRRRNEKAGKASKDRGGARGRKVRNSTNKKENGRRNNNRRQPLAG